MQQRDLGRLAIKLTSLVAVVYLLIGLPMAVFQLVLLLNSPGYHEPHLAAAAQALLPSVGTIAVAALLYLAAGAIVDGVLRLGSSELPLVSVDFAKIEQIAVALIGVYIFSTGLAEGIYYLGKADLYYRYAIDKAFMPPTLGPENFGGLAAAATRVVVGVALFLGSSGVVGLRQRLVAVRPLHQPD